MLDQSNLTNVRRAVSGGGNKACCAMLGQMASERLDNDGWALPRVRLPGTGIEVSRLGFGTSALMSRVNRRDSLRLLETALDEGITHLDTARSYGFGEAELVLGDLLAGRRSRITVTTKVGILPPHCSLGLSAAKYVARGLLSVLPAARASLRRGAGGLIHSGRFDARSMSESLETSLRRLRTDYVDILLLHEPSAEILATEEPWDFLRRVQCEGKVRHFGIAASPEVAENAPLYSAVMQLPNSVFAPSLNHLRSRSDRSIITHSAMTTRLEELRHWLANNAAAQARWSGELQMNVLQQGMLERLSLQYAFADLLQGAVLFTSTKPAHIRENAAALRTEVPIEQLHRFAQLVREWMTRGGSSSFTKGKELQEKADSLRE